VISVIIPTLNAEQGLAATLTALVPAAVEGLVREVIVVDGGSTDRTLKIAETSGAEIVRASGGRGLQLAAGAERARFPWLLFLHADTRLPPLGDVLALQSLAEGACWGRLDVRIEGRPRMLRVVAALMNLRSRLSGIATGDQAIFVTRAAFERVGGFPVQPLMEDVELSRRLKEHGRPACLRARLVTSGRRWEERGVWRTIVLMWWLRWRYWRGEPAERLAQAYR